MRHVKDICNELGAMRVALVVSVVLTSLACVAAEYSNQNSARNVQEKQDVYRSVEQMPQFPGGEAALMKYLQSQIKYPPGAMKDSVQGRVVVQFVVDSTGHVGEIKVVRSVREDLDAEAVRVIKTLPRFAPGRVCGKAVSVWYTLPVTFKLKSPGDAEEKDEEVKREYKRDVKVKYEAQFPGGEDALTKYISDHIKYPPKAAKKKIQGRVTVEYLVDKTGKVSDVRVIDSSGNKDLDREAVRVIKSLPDFVPASVDGEPVDIWIHQHVRFDIPGIERQWVKSVKVQPK